MNSILINLPTNIGDVILALEVLDKARTNFPKSKITVITSPRTKDFLLRNTLVDEVVVFDKHWKATHKLRFSLDLRGKYNIMIDLKNSFLPILLGAKIHTPLVRQFSNKVHIVDKYLKVVSKIIPKPSTMKSDFLLSEDEKNKWATLNIAKAIFIACTSLSRIKQYPRDYTEKVVELLSGKHRIVVLGHESERDFYKDILNRPEVIDLVGKTAIWEVFYLLKKYASLLVGVDSSLTHMASYLEIPVVSMFGPTSYERSCPRSKYSVALRKEGLDCLPCEAARCHQKNECMKIEPEEVVKSVTQIISKINLEE